MSTVVKIKEPRPGFEWIITDRCNYTCSYCFQRQYADNRHCSDETVNAVFRLLPTLQGSWLVKPIGGEPLIHPRFFEICKTIAEAGHTLCTTTNFSLPYRKLQELIDACGDKLASVTVSLHLTQIKNLDDFIQKVVAFNSNKHPATHLAVTSVILAEHFERLKQIERRLKDNGITFAYQPLRSGGQYVRYEDQELEDYIADKLVWNTDKIRHRSLFGTLCHTGQLFFKIEVNGDVVRCYNIQPLYYLGNITKGTFRRFQEAKPCLARRCTCVFPVNRNMIRFGQRADTPTIAKACLRACPGSLPHISLKVLNILRKQVAWRTRSGRGLSAIG